MKHPAQVFCLASVACAVACLDLSPVDYKPPASRPDAAVGGRVDGGDDDGGSSDASTPSMVEQCRACLMGGACGAGGDKCFADAKCSKFAQCVTRTDCWRTRITDLNNSPACLNDCGQEADIQSQADPAIALVVPVLLCAQAATQCASTCAPNLIE